MSDLKRDLIRLIRAHSYREGDFTLASGKKSTFYINMKATTLSAEGAWLIGRLATEVLSAYATERKLKIGGVGGLTLGADPIATAVSMAAYEKKLDWPAYIVRKEAKGHGTGKVVEGAENLAAGAPLIVLEDVVTTGGSSLQAIEKLRAEGYVPRAVLTVVDREQGGRECFVKAGVDFLALATISEIRSGG